MWMRAMMKSKTKEKPKEVKEEEKDIGTVELTIEANELDLSVSQLGGVGAITAKKLEEFGVTSLVDICVRGSKELSEITGVAKVKTNVWVTESQKILEEAGMVRNPEMGVLELLEYREKLYTLGTKTEVDTLLRGGVKPECLYEVYGEFGSGKTQFCLTLAAEAIADGHKIVWIDCEDTFRPRRLAEIIVARGYAVDTEDAKQYLKNIHYYYCPNTEQMMGKVNALSHHLFCIRTIIIMYIL
jgi:DNA repair protein RadA